MKLYDRRTKQKYSKVPAIQGKDIFINNDFSKATSELKKDLMVEVKRPSELRKISYFNYTEIISSEKVGTFTLVRYSGFGIRDSI